MLMTVLFQSRRIHIQEQAILAAKFISEKIELWARIAHLGRFEHSIPAPMGLGRRPPSRSHRSSGIGNSEELIDFRGYDALERAVFGNDNGI
jgi:hypothetical protein